MPTTPKRMDAKLRPAPQSRFLSQILAKNIKDRRSERKLSQSVLAERMVSVGHGKWTRATVTEIERENRSVSVDELLGLALVLGVPIGELLDPTGIDGQGREGLDYTLGAAPPMRVEAAREWVRGRLRIWITKYQPRLEWAVEPIGDSQAEQMEALFSFLPRKRKADVVKPKAPRGKEEKS
jgi:transcriptional regulator with XRE-family HTH domain